MDSLDDKGILGLLPPRECDALGSTCSGSRVTFSTRSTADSSSMCSLENSAPHSGCTTPPRVHVMTQLRDMSDHISCLAQSREDADQPSLSGSEAPEASENDSDQQGAAGSRMPSLGRPSFQNVDMLTMMRQMDSNMTVQQFLQNMERGGSAGSKGQTSCTKGQTKARVRNQPQVSMEGEETRRRIGGSLPYTDRAKAGPVSPESIGTNPLMLAQLSNLEHQISVHGRAMQNIDGHDRFVDSSDYYDQESVDMDDDQYQQYQQPYHRNPSALPQRQQFPMPQGRNQAPQLSAHPQPTEYPPQQAYHSWSGGPAAGSWGGPPAGAAASRHGAGLGGGYPQHANGGYGSGPQVRHDLQGHGDMGPCSTGSPFRQQPQRHGQWQPSLHPQAGRQYYPQLPPWQQQQQQPQPQQQQPGRSRPPQQFHQQPAHQWQQVPPHGPLPPQQPQALHRQPSPAREQQHYQQQMVDAQPAPPCAYALEPGCREGCNPAAPSVPPAWSHDDIAAPSAGKAAPLETSCPANAAAAPVSPGSAAEAQEQAQMLLRTFGTLTEQVCFWAGDVDLCADERCQLGNLVLNCVKPCIHMDQGLAEFYMDLQAELRSLREELEQK